MPTETTMADGSSTTHLRVPPSPDTVLDDLTDTEVEDDRVGITIIHPREFQLERVSDAEIDDRHGETCMVPRWRLMRPGETLEIESVPADCDVDNADPGNGDHGYYRTLDDCAHVECEENAEELRTSAGTAHLFTQPYYECTNECDDYTDRVAIVTLDRPTDPNHPTVVIRSNKDEIPAWFFEKIVRDLEPGAGR